PEDLRTRVDEGGPVVHALLPGGDVPLTTAETPAWASLRRLVRRDDGALALELATGIRHVDLADHPPEVHVDLVPRTTSYAPGAMAPQADDVPRVPLRTTPVATPDVSGLRYVDQRPGGRIAVLAPEQVAEIEGGYAVEVTVR